MGTDSAHGLVAALEERLSELESRFHEAYWDAHVEATPERDRRRAELELELRRVKGDPDALAGIEAALQEGVLDPLLRRQLEVLRLSFRGNQMDEERRVRLVQLMSSVESDFANYRPEIEGRAVSDNDIEHILRSSNDERLRRRAWEASKEIGGVVAGRVLELARLRNQAARDLGYADYYRMGLELQEISEQWLFEVMDELERLTEEPFQEWKGELDGRLARRFATDEVRPWHYADPFFQTPPPDGAVSLDGLLNEASAPALALETFAPWGVDLSEVLAASDLYPKGRKCQHAFCLHVDRMKGDVRILANVVPGERWIEIMLHESGHAAYDLCIETRLPYVLRRPAHTFVTEAVALLAGRLVRSPRWLVEVADVARAEVEEMQDRLARASAVQSLLFARWGLVVVHFERELYSDPEADLSERWWELVQRFQGVAPPGRSHPDWAAKIHVAAAPVYYHNYLLGEVFASQLEALCERECGGLVGVSAAGELLRQRLFRPGALMRWDALIEETTGARLDVVPFAARAKV